MQPQSDNAVFFVKLSPNDACTTQANHPHKAACGSASHVCVTRMRCQQSLNRLHEQAHANNQTYTDLAENMHGYL